MNTISISSTELNLQNILINGSCFVWNYNPLTSSWIGIVGNLVVELTQPTSEEIKWRILNSSSILQTKEQIESILLNYLSITQQDLKEINLESLYKEWSNKDETYFKQIVVNSKCSGIRILRQDPFECFISFLCSSNNNIKRITSMLSKLRETYGTLLYSFSSEENNIIKKNYYQFPTLDQLIEKKCTEEGLRKMGFGYRAKYIIKSISLLQELGGETWLKERINNTSSSSTEKVVIEELQQFCGIGKKVASCIALYGLYYLNVVPLDTHMNQLLSKYYTSLEDYEKKFGKYSGLVQSILFTNKVFGSSSSSKNKRKKEQTFKNKKRKLKKDLIHSTFQSGI